MNRNHNSAAASASLFKRLVLGAFIGLIVITFFVLSGGDRVKPEWGKLWMIRPLVVVPFAGAVGGLCHFYINNLPLRTNWGKGLAVVLSLVVFLFALWLGTILGLDGTLWN